MRRFLPLSLLLLTLVSAPASADPGIIVQYHDELLRVRLEGSYAGSYYRIFRSDGRDGGTFNAMSAASTLCTGDCFLTDLEALPGKTYEYRFDVQPPAGNPVSYGPYAVTVPDTPVGVRIVPNPSNSRTSIELALPGSTRRDAPLEVDARVIDLQGRTVRVLHSGPLPRGVTSLAWDGRGSAGQAVGAGIYFVRLSTPLGVSTRRIVRFL
jgi:hypothetical protein